MLQGGPRSITVAGAGTAVAIDVLGDQTLFDDVARAWSRALTDQEPTIRISVCLSADPADADVTGLDRELVLGRLSQQLTMKLLTAGRGSLMMFHATALANPVTGKSAVLVAPSKTGKTTVAKALCDEFGYVTDETVAIDSQHRILPYEKPLSVRFPNGTRRELSADELGLKPTPGTATVGRLVLLRRSEDHPAEPIVTELDDFDAIIALVSETSSLSQLDRPLQQLAKLIDATGPVLEARFRQAPSLRPLVASLVSS